MIIELSMLHVSHQLANLDLRWKTDLYTEGASIAVLLAPVQKPKIDRLVSSNPSSALSNTPNTSAAIHYLCLSVADPQRGLVVLYIFNPCHPAVGPFIY